jgi:ribosomal-protein-alanine N-acetyltransferase
MQIPVLETKRLFLRPLTVDDAEAVFTWVSDERVTKFMPYSTYTNIDQVKDWLSNLSNETETNHFGFVLKENNLLIGAGDIGYNQDTAAWDFGYNLRYDYWNQGYTTEATKAMMKFAYDKYGARDFSSNHAVDNIASGKVMEKCGLTYIKDGTYSKFDKSQTFQAKYYKAHLEEL